MCRASSHCHLLPPRLDMVFPYTNFTEVLRTICLGFGVTALGSNNEEQALTIARTGNVTVANHLNVTGTITNTGLQTQLDKIPNLANGPSGLSLGTGSGASQRIAVYEVATSGAYAAGHFHYGIALAELGTNAVGLCFFGGTGNAPARNATALTGTLPSMLLNTSGNLGVGTIAPAHRLTCGRRQHRVFGQYCWKQQKFRHRT